MDEAKKSGLATLRSMLTATQAATVEEMQRSGPSETFASELADLSLDALFGALWSRPGLSPRDRSLVTLGILIALRAGDEMRWHFQIALNNGLTRAELAEVIYHSSGYAGFPAAGHARTMAAQAIGEKEDQPQAL